MEKEAKLIEYSSAYLLFQQNIKCLWTRGGTPLINLQCDGFEKWLDISFRAFNAETYSWWHFTEEGKFRDRYSYWKNKEKNGVNDIFEIEIY